MSGKPDEATPLQKTDDFCEHVKKAYGCSDHCKHTDHYSKQGQVITDYDPWKFSSMRVFLVSKGTVLKDPILLTEQLLITLVFLGFAIPTYILFAEDLGASRHGAVSVRLWLKKQEPLMRQFAAIMTGLASFLLTFYTAMAVTRWWTMRSAGVGGIKASTVELETYIYQLVTKEEAVLSAIRRYGRTSLILLFLWRSNELEPTKMRSILVGGNFLTDEEVDKLLQWNHCLHETIWAWQAGIVTMLYKEGMISSDNLFRLLMERVSNGRKAVQTVHTHLGVRIPMQYVHLLGMLVKMHNAVLAIIMGILVGAAVRNGQTIIVLQGFCRTLLLPMLFNAILLINVQLSDPFSGNETDFPGSAYEKTLNKDCEGAIEATKNLPDWVLARMRN